MNAAPGTSGKKKRALAAAQAQAEAAPAAAAATPADAKSSKKRAKLEAAAPVTTADATGPSPSSSSGDGSAKHGKAAGSVTPKLAQVQAPSGGQKSALRASIKAFALSPNAETPSKVAAGSAGTGGPSRQTQAHASVSASLPPGKRPRAELGGGKAAMQAQPLAGHSTQAEGSGSAARKVQTAVKAAKQVCGAMWDAGCSCVVGVHMHAASATFSPTCLCIRSQGAIAYHTTAQYTHSLL